MRMMGRKRPDGTAMPKVMRPRVQYTAKNMRREMVWNSVGVEVEKMLRTASSLVAWSRLARSL